MTLKGRLDRLEGGRRGAPPVVLVQDSFGGEAAEDGAGTAFAVVMRGRAPVTVPRRPGEGLDAFVDRTGALQ